MVDEDKITYFRRMRPDGTLMPADAEWTAPRKPTPIRPLDVIVSEFEEKSRMLENCPYFKFSECYCSDLVQFVFERRINLLNDVQPFEDKMSAEYLNWREQKRKGNKVMDYKGYACWRYNPIVFYVDGSKKNGRNKHRIILKDDTETYDFLDERQFAIMAPLTYVGRNNNALNARYLYAFAVDLDGVRPRQLKKLFWMMSDNAVPVANIIVNSGHGLHVYYLLDTPVPLYADSIPLLNKIKRGLTNIVWNENTSEDEYRQYQTIFQAFRLPGTLTKFGKPIRAFFNEDAPMHTLEELNGFFDLSRLTDEELKRIGKKPVYDPTGVTLDEAQRRWPEWYAKRIVEKKRVGKKWNVNRAVYDWWLDRLRTTEKEIKVHHRYWCILTLVVYGVKCDVPREEVLEDGYSLVDKMDSYTDTEDNHFTKTDVDDAMRAYDENYCKWTIDTIEKTTTFHIDRNRRNGRVQAEHLKIMNFIRDNLSFPNGNWRDGNGRKHETPETSKAAAQVGEWRINNPASNNKSQCAKDTGLTRPTVRKWWNYVQPGEGGQN